MAEFGRQQEIIDNQVCHDIKRMDKLESILALTNASVTLIQEP